MNNCCDDGLMNGKLFALREIVLLFSRAVIDLNDFFTRLEYISYVCREGYQIQ